jgi:hypothetical protein
MVALSFHHHELRTSHVLVSFARLCRREVIRNLFLKKCFLLLNLSPVNNSKIVAKPCAVRWQSRQLAIGQDPEPHWRVDLDVHQVNLISEGMAHERAADLPGIS